MKDKPDQQQNINFQDVALGFGGAVVTIVTIPVTVPALTTAAAAAAVGGAAVYVGRRANRDRVTTLGRNSQGKRDRDDNQEMEAIERERTPDHPGDEDYPEEWVGGEATPRSPSREAQADENADEINDMLQITNKTIFIRIFTDRVSNNQSSKEKGTHTRFLNNGLNGRIRTILRDMIQSQYINRIEAAKAARLFWQLKTGEKTEAQLSDDEKKLLKIVVMRAGADVPWWENHNDDDDSDPGSSAAESNNGDDDNDPDTGACYIAHETEDSDSNADDTLDIHTDTHLIPANTHNKNISYETPVSENNAASLNIIAIAINETSSHAFSGQGIIDIDIDSVSESELIKPTVAGGHPPLLAMASEG